MRIEKALRNYQEKKKADARALQLLDEYGKHLPKKPIQATVGEGRKFKKAMKKYDRVITDKVRVYRAVGEAMSDAKYALMKLIPVNCVWIKAGDMAVGKAARGIYLELFIRKWSSNLPELQDT